MLGNVYLHCVMLGMATVSSNISSYGFKARYVNINIDEAFVPMPVER